MSGQHPRQWPDSEAACRGRGEKRRIKYTPEQSNDAIVKSCVLAFCQAAREAGRGVVRPVFSYPLGKGAVRG